MSMTRSLAVLLLALSAGVSAAQEVRTTSTVGSAATDGLSLYPGDAIKLLIWQEPDLSGTFRVDENGMVTLPLLGPRSVVNTSPIELRNSLVQEYGAQIKNPSIEVTVLRRISVVGEVQKPGVFDVDPTMRLGEVIAMAGGVTPTGNSDKITLFRNGVEIAEDLDVTAPVGNRLWSGDQVVVEKTSWVSRNQGMVIGMGATITGLVLRGIIR